MISFARVFATLLASSSLISCTSPSSSGIPASVPPPADEAGNIIKPFFLCYKERLRTLYPYQFLRLNAAGTYQLDTTKVANYLRVVAECGPLSAHYRATLAQRLRQLTLPQEGEVLGLVADPVVLNGDNEDFIACVDTARVRLRHVTPQRRVYSFPASMPLLVTVVPAGHGWQLDAVAVDEQAMAQQAAAELVPR
jgi:hypothetical protein